MIIFYNPANNIITGIQSFPETTELPHIVVNNVPDCLPDAINLVSLVHDGESLQLPDVETIEQAIVEHNIAVLVESTRSERDRRINAEMWRYDRAAREARLGITPTDDIDTLDAYIQALADVPQQAGFPDNIEWPTLTL